MFDEYIDKIITGNCVDIMGVMPDDCIDMVLTSPPYDNLRDYKGYCFDYEKVLSSIYRVLKVGGVCVWIVNDATINGSESGSSFKQALYAMSVGFNLHDTMIYLKDSSSFPSRVSGVRYSQIFEYMFVFSKGKPKTVNLICDKPNKLSGLSSWGKSTNRNKKGLLVEKPKRIIPEFSPRNNVWTISAGFNCSTQDKDAYKHPAIFPEKLAMDHILTWTNINDIVLDPMCGSGTSCKMARLLNRKFIGIDISQYYVDIATNRLSKYNKTLFD